jgi:hypothetical protein
MDVPKCTPVFHLLAALRGFRIALVAVWLDDAC